MRQGITKLALMALAAALVLALVPAGALAQDATFQGVVTDEDTGEPLAGVQVLAVGETSDAAATTEEDGSFSLELDPGQYLVFIQRDDTGTEQFQLAVNPGEEITREISLAVFEEIGTIHGALTDQGVPVTQELFLVEAERREDGESFWRLPFAGDEGEFHFLLPPGQYSLEVLVEGREPVETEALVTADEAARVDLELDAEPPAPGLRLWPGSQEVEREGDVDEELEPGEVPFIEEGRTFVPMRFIGESLGAQVDYTTDEDGFVDQVFLERGPVTVEITIGEDVLVVVEAGETRDVDLDVPAQIQNGRTFLPFRAVGEAFGMDVDYGVGDDGLVEWVSYGPAR